MTPFQRDASIKKFSNDPTVTVFLISLKAGGVALNLTAASRVFICDPWWNPAAGLYPCCVCVYVRVYVRWWSTEDEQD